MLNIWSNIWALCWKWACPNESIRGERAFREQPIASKGLINFSQHGEFLVVAGTLIKGTAQPLLPLTPKYTEEHTVSLRPCAAWNADKFGTMYSEFNPVSHDEPEAQLRDFDDWIEEDETHNENVTDFILRGHSKRRLVVVDVSDMDAGTCCYRISLMFEIDD